MRKLLVPMLIGVVAVGGPLTATLASTPAHEIVADAPVGASSSSGSSQDAAGAPAGDGRGKAKGKPDTPPGQAKKDRPGEEPPVAEVVPAPTVAVIDTGARATHQEFTYGGPASTTDQFVGWWDFTSEVKGTIDLPEPGQTWDDQVADPYDRNGHGTWTASMAAGRNVNPDKDPSAAPGFPLAVAKVGNGDGAIEGSIGDAVRWAAFSVGADVINISIGSIVPVPAALAADEYAAIAEARRSGKLVVVSNGNGFANAGIPGDPGWASWYASSTDVLAVGADDIDSFTAHTDPEVVAKYYDLLMADFESDTGYSRASGTSFSSPFTAGYAARLLHEARRAGRSPAADYLETLVKYSAADRPAVTPNFEGYGVVSMATLDAAIVHARAGSLPARPTPDPSGFYTESVSGSLRDVWSNKARGSLANVVPLGIGGNGAGLVGPSAPSAVSDAELMTVQAPAGTTVSVRLDFVAPEGEDIDLYVFSGTTGPFTADRLVASSTNASGSETVTFRSAGPVTVMALGWLVTGDVPITFTSTSPLTFAGDGYAAHTMGTGL